MEKVVINIDKCSKDELISALNSIKPSNNNEPRQFDININEIVSDKNENNERKVVINKENGKRI